MTRPFSAESAMAHKLIGDPNHAELFQYFDTVGDGSGAKDMATTARTYRVTPPTGMMYIVDEIRIVGWDETAAAGLTFMGISALSVGCKLEIRAQPGASNEVVIEDLTGGLTIKSNGQLATLGETILFNQSDTAECLVQCSIKGIPYRLDGNAGESFVFQTQDTLANVTEMYVAALGRKYTNLI